jgi:hypothetical protein
MEFFDASRFSGFGRFIYILSTCEKPKPENLLASKNSMCKMSVIAPFVFYILV